MLFSPSTKVFEKFQGLRCPIFRQLVFNNVPTKSVCFRKGPPFSCYKIVKTQSCLLVTLDDHRLFGCESFPHQKMAQNTIKELPCWCSRLKEKNTPFVGQTRRFVLFRILTQCAVPAVMRLRFDKQMNLMIGPLAWNGESFVEMIYSKKRRKIHDHWSALVFKTAERLKIFKFKLNYPFPLFFYKACLPFDNGRFAFRTQLESGRTISFILSQCLVCRHRGTCFAEKCYRTWSSDLQARKCSEACRGAHRSRPTIESPECSSWCHLQSKVCHHARQFPCCPIPQVPRLAGLPGGHHDQTYRSLHRPEKGETCQRWTHSIPSDLPAGVEDTTPFQNLDSLQVNVGSLEKIIHHFLDEAEVRAKEAQTNSEDLASHLAIQDLGLSLVTVLFFSRRKIKILGLDSGNCKNLQRRRGSEGWGGGLGPLVNYRANTS